MLAIFLDMETTGLDQTRHHAIDVALVIMDVNSGKKLASYQSLIKQPKEIFELADPLSLEINGYTYDMITHGKEVQVVRDEIIDLFQKHEIQRGLAVFICQNPGFDRTFFTKIIDVYTQEKLNWPYHWLDLASMYWARLLEKCQREGVPFPEKINLSKNVIAKEYQIEPEETPHLAMNGVNHLIACYKAVNNS